MLTLLSLLLIQPALALPADLRAALDPDPAVPLVEVQPVDKKAQLALDRQQAGGPVRMAVAREVSVDLVREGRWEPLPDGRRALRLRVRAAGAEHLSLAFSEARLPEGAELWLHGTDGRHALSRPMTAAHARKGGLWTPLVEADEIGITLVVPPGTAPALELSRVHVGYKALGEAPPPQGYCNIDVVCPESAGWEEEIHSVAVYALYGELWCTGFVLGNTRNDETPYFATANHCGVTSGNADTLVVYWNYQSPECGDLSGGSPDQWTAGSTLRLQYSRSDLTLVELDELPEPDFEVSYAGWDRSGAAPTSAVGIHHPGTDEKAISFENDPLRITDSYEDREDLEGTHIRVGDWDLGTTEGGSSGSPLFDQDHRAVGVLTGGDAACGNNDPDWYGRLALAFDGGLDGWLDPEATGASTLDTFSPWATGIAVRPLSGLESSGPEGGPFSPEGLTLTVENRDPAAARVTLSTDADWVFLSADSLELDGEETGSLILSIGEAARALPPGRHEATVSFSSESSSATVPVRLLVGEPTIRYQWSLDTDPGWETEGDWAFGVPQGRGGDEGRPDPTSGATGDNVYGYNLDGDYPDRMRAEHLTTPALDLSGLVGTSLRFQRWLGVEESTYDHARVELSLDGETWETVWENSGEVDDGEWVPQVIDISALADDQPAVRIRWAMGSTDGDLRYCGWNIDDIEIVGIELEPLPQDTAEPQDTAGTDTAIENEDEDPPGLDPEDRRNKDVGFDACACAAGSRGAASGIGLVALLALIRRRRR